jgi:hypothetical protein
MRGAAERHVISETVNEILDRYSPGFASSASTRLKLVALFSPIKSCSRCVQHPPRSKAIHAKTLERGNKELQFTAGKRW